MGGREAVRKILSVDPHARVIVSSGYSNDHVMSQFQRYGFQGAVAKPYRIHELSDTLQAVLRGAPTPNDR
jgi:DNA-binding NarL/FixJ family response regulator